jgi:hypothetical protein
MRKKDLDMPDNRRFCDGDHAVLDQLAQELDVLVAGLGAVLDVERGLREILGGPAERRPRSVGGSA